MVKQVIIFRRDLNMRKGKIAAQVAHASMKVFFDRARSSTLGAGTREPGGTNSPPSVYHSPWR